MQPREYIEQPERTVQFIHNQVEGKLYRNVFIDVSKLQLTDEQKSDVAIEMNDGLTVVGKPDLDSITFLPVHEELLNIRCIIDQETLRIEASYNYSEMYFSIEVWNAIANILAVSLQDILSKPVHYEKLPASMEYNATQARLRDTQVGWKARLFGILEPEIRKNEEKRIEKINNVRRQQELKKHHQELEEPICAMLTKVITSIQQ